MKKIAEQIYKIEICERVNEYKDEVEYVVLINGDEAYTTWQLESAYHYANFYYNTNFGKEK